MPDAHWHRLDVRVTVASPPALMICSRASSPRRPNLITSIGLQRSRHNLNHGSQQVYSVRSGNGGACHMREWQRRAS
ncbi:hypothetical protein BC826DRAFT_1063342 [Russula brevipes]|nr:hypothetical protein BC826DRAFT_1063342 [Russula brevipes]